MTVLIIFLMLIFAGSNVLCFLVGARTAQRIESKEPIELPNLNPVKAYRDHQHRKEADAEQRKIDAIMENIDNYNGTSSGQKDIPRG